MTVRTVQRLEAGNDGSLDTLARVAEAFGVPVRELFVTVAEDDYGCSVTALDERTTRQQERRGRVEEGCRALNYGVGVLFTIAVVVAVTTDVVPNVAIFLIPAYWVAGWLAAVDVPVPRRPQPAPRPRLSPLPCRD
ncbi:XRE family transcriptional regulator [uncultured Frigoribacterium sp.]|uniref:helix-turn-helix domain-containing protein n=1 Tax=uncultured Frigoribacterium sp. TaxID=335377 RepID=UPI0028D7FF01|nr:XRE family transcriptional regulator [uncultured Frigoribacterium sp.]